MTADEVLHRILPQFFPAHWLDPPGLVFGDFPSRIRIGYVVQRKGNYSYICRHEFSGLSISLQVLHAAALTNLDRASGAAITIAKVPGGSEGWISSTEDNFAAVRILLPEVQAEFCRELGDEFLVALPHRDECFCWSVAQTKDRQERHIRKALESFMQEQYNLTPDILKFSRGNFQVYREQDTG